MKRFVEGEDRGQSTLFPKPLTSSSEAKGRFGKQDVVYVAADDGHIGG